MDLHRHYENEHQAVLNAAFLGNWFTRVEVESGNTELVFYRGDTKLYALGHQTDCCEAVWLEDINGDLDDLVHAPITKFEERTESSWSGDEYESTTWTFYHIATPKGTVILRWCGQSNGYYSETVDFFDFTKD